MNFGKFRNFWNFENQKNRDLSKGSVINENEISKSKKMKIKRVSNQNGMSLSGHMINLMWQNDHVMLKLITIILLSRKWSTNFGSKLRMITKCIRGVSWNAPKTMWRRYFSRESYAYFSWNAPKSKIFIFGSFLVLKLITCFFLEMPHFSYLILKMGKMGHFRKNEHKKVGHFEKKARDQF